MKQFQLFTKHILPILEYSNTVYTLNNKNIEKIEKVQKKITKFLCFKTNIINVNYIERLKYLKLLPLSVRRDVKILKIINRIILNLNIHDNWSNSFEFKSNRNGNTIIIKKSRINLCDRNLFSYASKLYNSLPINQRLSDNFLIDIKEAQLFLHNKFIQNYL